MTNEKEAREEMLIDGKRIITSSDPCCKFCVRGECEFNVNGMCLNKGVCGRFAPPRKEAWDGE